MWMEPSAITSAPAPTVVSTVRSLFSAYTCCPLRTGEACIMPGAEPLREAGACGAGASAAAGAGFAVRAGAGAVDRFVLRAELGEQRQAEGDREFCDLARAIGQRDGEDAGFAQAFDQRAGRVDVRRLRQAAEVQDHRGAFEQLGRAL